MSTPPESEKKAPKQADESIQALVKNMGQCINLQSLYGVGHKLVADAETRSLESLKAVFDSFKQIDFAVEDKVLLINGQAANMNNPFIATLGVRIEKLAGTSFSMRKGISPEEFSSLLAGLSAGNMQEQIKTGALKHVSAERVSYQRMRAGQHISDGTSERSADAAVAFEEALRGGATASGASGNTPPSQRKESVTEIMAFLKGDVSIPSEMAAAGLSSMATDADRLAGLVMQAVTVHSGGMAQGESLADIVVGCLRRTMQGLEQNPSSKTPQGTKDLKKTLLLLEKNVLQRLHKMRGGRDLATEQYILAETAEMSDEIEVSRMAEAYAGQRAKMNVIEQQLHGYIKRKGADSRAGQALQQHLSAGGLDSTGWKELVVRAQEGASGTKGKKGAGGGGADNGGLGALTTLLSRLDDLMEGVSTAEEQKKATQAIVEHNDQSVTSAKERIEALSNERKDLLETLAELTQELAQPLTAMNCSVDMTLSECIGPLTGHQKEMLTLASNSGSQLHDLFQRLIKISGLPEGLLPDKERIYGG